MNQVFLLLNKLGRGVLLITLAIISLITTALVLGFLVLVLIVVLAAALGIITWEWYADRRQRKQGRLL